LKSILVFAPNWVGDAVMATPAIRALHQRFPEARLTVGARSPICAMLSGLPFVHDFLPLDAYKGFGASSRFRRTCLARGFDGAVVFPHSFRGAWMARLSGAPRRLGYGRNGRAWLLSDAPPPYQENGRPTPIYMASEYLDLVAQWGCVDDGAGLELHADADEVAIVQARLHPTRPVVALAPGAAFGPSKRWPAERYGAVIDALAAREIDTLLLWGPGEEETRDLVLSHCQAPVISPYDDDKPGIPRLKAAIASARLLIGNDSGPRHIAIAFQKPVICIMGPTSPRYTNSPWEKGALLRVDVDCGPCQKPVCHTDHRCMRQIHIEDVVHAALAHLPAPWGVAPG